MLLIIMRHKVCTAVCVCMCKSIMAHAQFETTKKIKLSFHIITTHQLGCQLDLCSF